MSINQGLHRGNNNLNFIRFCMAALVVYSHAWPITLGTNLSEPLAVLSKGQGTLGDFAVDVFFMISGFLITFSYMKNKDLKHFFASRIFRIYPGIIICVFVTTFIIGPLVTQISLSDYFSNGGTFAYLIKSTVFFGPNSLPGVFEGNPFGNPVNGSLWTLRYELVFYVMVAILGRINILNKKFVMTMFIGSLILSELSFTNSFVGFRLLALFSVGMLFYLYKDSIVFNWKLLSISFVLIVLSVLFGHYYNFIFKICGAYLTFYVCLGNNKFNWFENVGDYSYGLYIYAFPIQQAVVYFMPNMTPLKNFFVSMPFIFICAYLSWHLVEERAMKYKSRKLRATN